MLTTEISQKHFRRSICIYCIIGVVGLCLFVLIVYSMRLGSEVAGQYALLVDAVKEMQYETTNANLLIERSHLGERNIAKQDIQQSRSRAEALNRILLSGGNYQGIRVPTVSDPELRGRLHHVRKLQDDFYDVLEDYWTHLEQSASLSADKPYVVMSAFSYEKLMSGISGAEQRLKWVVSSKLNRFQLLQFSLIGVTLLWAIGAGWIMWVFVSSLERQNNRLSESENRTRLLLEKARDMVFLVDMHDHRIVDVNEEACEVLGFEKSSLVGTFMGVIEAQGKLEACYHFGDSDSCPQSHLVDAVFTKCNGESLSVEVNLGFLTINQRDYWLGIVRDISERKRMEEELMQAKRLAEAANLTKSEFLANMSHEVRTPINGIMGMLQLLQTTPCNDEQDEYIDLGIQSCKTLTGLINNILDLSGVESGTVQIWRESFCIRELMYGIEASFSQQLANKKLHFDVQISDDVPEELVGDAKRINQVLISLVGNAVKFTETGGIKLQVSLRMGKISAAPTQSWVRFEITDTGPGISETQMITIFEPFQQGDGSCTRKYQGAGLGLAVVEKLVGKMEGTVSVESQLGIGSSFIVELPLDFRTSSVSKGQNILAATHGLFQGKRALVVDDNQMNRKTVVEIMRKMGIDAVAASSGSEALEIFGKQTFDFALMDVQMPGMDGLMLTQRIRQLEKETCFRPLPIIALTAHALKGDRERFLEAGMNDYLAKPFTIRELEARIASLLTCQAPQSSSTSSTVRKSASAAVA